MEKFYVLSLILLSLSAAYTDSHSLRYYYIGVSAPGSGLPEFSKVGYVDDEQIDFYSSDIGRTIPVATWMKEKMGPEHWESETFIDRGHETLFRHEVKMVMNRFNHTAGPYVMQVMDSCVLRDDGTIVGSKQFSYDGEEYMYLDMKAGTFIPTRTEARVTTQRWNSPDLRIGERRKNYLENKCIDRLKKFLELGKEYLERRVQPKVKVSGRESGDVTKLHCVVYGFHPRAVDVRWMKNGVDDVPTYETTHVLPNPDGTYQIRVSVDVISNEVDTYLCYVDHSSLEEPLLVPWELKQNFSRAVIFSVMVTILLVLSSVVVGVILYKIFSGKKMDYTSVTKPKQISSWPPVVIGGTVIIVLLLTSIIGAVIIYK